MPFLGLSLLIFFKHVLFFFCCKLQSISSETGKLFKCESGFFSFELSGLEVLEM